MAGGGGGGRHLRRTRSAGEARAGAAPPPPRRRSERNGAPPAVLQPLSQEEPRAGQAARSPRPAPLAMRPITLKKILPRSRQLQEVPVAPRRSPRTSGKEDKENVPARSPGRGDAGAGLVPSPLRSPSSEPPAGDPPGGTAVLSPLSSNLPGSPPGEGQDLTMAKRVRRSYSRLEASLSRSFLESRGDASTPSGGPGKRQTLFGFEKLLLPDEAAGLSPGISSAPLKAAETTGALDALLEPDPDLPGIAFGKEKRRKKKVPQFEKLELDQWAAEMNAQFEEAEQFNLLVE